MTTRTARLAIALIALSACTDQGPKRVTGSARIVHGAKGASTSPAPNASSRTGASAPIPANGVWGISPNEAKATVTQLEFIDIEGVMVAATFANTCAPTEARSGQSLSQILDCPFTIDAGTYVGLNLGVKNEFELLIDDPVNGLYTDPASSSKLSTTPPAGGAKLVSVTIPLTQGVGTNIRSTTIFTQPLVIDSASPPTITIVADMIHTIAVDVVNGVPSFNTGQIIPVIDMVASASGVGKVEYYNTYGTALNVRMPNVTGIDHQRVRVFYASGGQPTYLMSPMRDIPSAAYNTSPTANPTNPDGWRPGGYLGLDASGTLCWALPEDPAYAQYAYLLRMPVPAALGGSTTLSIQATTTVPAPTSGTTYSSGCPPVTATEQWNLKLVGR